MSTRQQLLASRQAHWRDLAQHLANAVACQTAIQLLDRLIAEAPPDVELMPSDIRLVPPIVETPA